jgi:hypothetical protein
LKGRRIAGIGRVTVRAAVIGFLAVVVIVTGAALVADMSVVSAIGIATFAAGWVGLAMGAMFGASLYADRIRDADKKSRPAQSSTFPTRCLERKATPSDGGLPVPRPAPAPQPCRGGGVGRFPRRTRRGPGR